MVNTYKYKGVTWIDLEKPTLEEVRALVETHGVDPQVAEELLIETPRSKAEKQNGYIYLVLHFPLWKRAKEGDGSQEIDFIVGRDFIVTARYQSFDPLHKFAKMFEVNSVLARNELVGESGGYMFYYMMREIYRSIEDQLESIREALRDIEKKTFAGDERAMVFEISETSRKLLAFKHSTSHHREALDVFASAAEKVLGPDFQHYMEATLAEDAKVTKTIQGLSESLREMRETNSDLLDAKQNQNIVTLTAITFITTVISVPIGLFEINFKYSPLIGMPNDFWIFTGLISCMALFFAGILVHKRWL